MEQQRGAGWILLAIALGWLAVARALARYGAVLLPRALAARLTLHSYLALGLICATALGLLACRVWLRDPWRALGMGRPPLTALGAATLLGPVVLALSAYLAFRIALPTLIAEIMQGGRRLAEQHTGAFGRALVQSHPLTTLLWAVVLTPVAEELLFRGALWSAVTRFSRRRARAAPSLPPELIDPGPVGRALAVTWRWLLDGGAATLITTAIFAWLHADQPGGAGIVRVVQAATLGLVLGLARHGWGSVWPGMMLHAIFNLLTIAKLRRWIVSGSWPHPLPVQIWWWQLAAGCAAVLLVWGAAHWWRRRGQPGSDPGATRQHLRKRQQHPDDGHCARRLRMAMVAPSVRPVTYRDRRADTLAELQPHERRVFGRLARLLLQTGESASATDRSLIEQLAERIGTKAFWACVEEAAGPAPAEAALAELARGVARTEVRTFIYAALSELAMADGMGDKQLGLLDWLAEIWHLGQHPVEGPDR